MQKIRTHLWFDKEAEEAVKLYTSVFKNSSIDNIVRYPNAEGLPGGQIMVVEFTLENQQYIALNAGPHFKFNEAIALYVRCEDQAEVDKYWEQLSAHPEAEQCGWLKDKFGLSWQIIPKQLEELMSDPDPLKAKRVAEAMLKMKKIEIAELEKARDE